MQRRAFLAGIVGAAISSKPGFGAILDAPSRSIAVNNIHTGEKLRVEYWAQGQYVPEALQSINHILRDFRTGDVHPIEAGLIDLLATLRARLDSVQPFEVISGYRSPATNANLRGQRAHSGVASKSLHMQGMAADIRLPGRDLDVLRRVALAERTGGVGYYPKSDFVHVDVGRFRTW